MNSSLAIARTSGPRMVSFMLRSVVTLALAWPVSAAIAGGGDEPRVATPPRTMSVGDWSDQLWGYAKEGDFAAVERYLRGVPEGRAEAGIQRLREGVEVLSRTRLESEAVRMSELEKAMTEARTKVAEGNLAQALFSLAMAKLLSDDWSKVLTTEEVQAVMDQSFAAALEAEKKGDLLLAQELLFRLRVLVDDSGDKALRDRFNDPLEQVNRRIGLLAQYAPHRLHDLRRLQAERVAPDKPFPDFNEEGAEDWKEQLRGISQPMLMAALRTAASEHIKNEGWWPLLTGGVEALRILGTTQALGENFPKLRDPERLAKWNETLDSITTTLDAKPHRGVGRGDYRDIIAQLIQTNRETIELPEEVLLREFGDGAVYKLAELFDDQYTEIIWPERLRRFQQQTEGNFVGVGILIRTDEKREIIVVNPLEGSPAFRAGVKPEDRVVAVDGVSTLGWSLNRAVDNITGPRGKEVLIGVRRGEGDDEKSLDIPIVRDTIKIRSVNGWWKRELDTDGNPHWDWLVDPISRIGYVRLTSFNEDSYADFLAALDEMKRGGPLNGLVLDLRNNPGGLLKSAVQFSNLFVPKGLIVSGEDKDGRTVWRQDAQPNRAEARLADVPTVVLVNEGSASASEIVAGSLQAHGAAVILGERSFGKGSVQTVHDISDREQAAIKLTTQYYVLPPQDGEAKGRLVHRRPGATDWGVNPDITVTMTPQQLEAAMKLRLAADMLADADTLLQANDGEATPRPDVNDLVLKGVDPQIQTALLILQARALKELELASRPS